jgi:hypothetical protein
VASSPLLDAWGVNFTLAILAAYLEAINSLHHRRRWLIACGLLAGLGGYFRPGVLLLPAALALATIAETGWRGALRRGVAVSAIAAVLLVPWTIRNYEDFHTFVAVRTGNGQTLWQGLGEVPNTFGAFSSDWFTYYQVRAAHPHYRYQSPAYDSYLQQQAIKAIKQHPLFYLKLVARRAVISTLWTFNPEWMHRGVKSPQTYGHGLIAYLRDRPLDLFQVALQPLVFILAMLTLGLTWRRRRDAHAILLATVVSVIAPYIVFYFEFRYALPAAFAYLILIGFGADLLIERAGLWRAERRPQSAVVASSRS